MWQTGIEVRRDISTAVLRKKALQEKDGRAAARLLAIANVLDGMSRKDAAEQAGMTRQTLRDWVIRYNAQGIEGARDLPKGHAKRALTPEQEERFAALVTQGPPIESALVRWRRIDLREVIEREFGVEYHERSVGKVLRRLGFVRLSVRPLHPETDVEAQEDFKKTSLTRSRKSCPVTPKEKPSKFGSRTRPALDRKAH